MWLTLDIHPRLNETLINQTVKRRTGGSRWQSDPALGCQYSAVALLLE